MEKLIKINNLTFWYGEEDEKNRNTQEKPILKNINLEIAKGEFLAVVGPNGSGKSTLARMLNGLLLPREGAVKVAGLDTKSPENLVIIRKTVGMVFQNPDNQLFASVVEEDVAFGLENLCLPQAEIRPRVEAALERLGMTEYRQHPPHRLSGGQKQKVAIAGLLAMRPACIVLDEPTSMLDSHGRLEVLQAVRSLNLHDGITIVYVTHDMNEVLHCDRIAALLDGEIIFTGTPGQFFQDDECLQKTGLFLPPIKALVRSLRDEGLRLPEPINSPEELVDAIC